MKTLVLPTKKEIEKIILNILDTYGLRTLDNYYPIKVNCNCTTNTYSYVIEYSNGLVSYSVPSMVRDSIKKAVMNNSKII